MTETKTNDIKMIKLKPDTVEILQNLKITKRESYDEVINRIFLQILVEDQLEVGEASKQVLMQRIKALREGRVKSFDQILESFRQRREVLVADEKREQIKKNPESKSQEGKKRKDATVGS